mgnify:FL=1
MGKENNIKLNTFVEINFADIFESMDNEILADMAENNPKQFKRMCIFLTLDHQIRNEGITRSGKKVLAD